MDSSQQVGSYCASIVCFVVLTLLVLFAEDFLRIMKKKSGTSRA